VKIGEKISTRRNTELALLLLAVGVVIFAYAQVGIAADGEFPPSIIGYAVGLFILTLVIHIVIRIRAPYADPVMLPVVTVINGIGLVMIHRLDLAYDARGREAGF